MSMSLIAELKKGLLLSLMQAASLDSFALWMLMKEQSKLYLWLLAELSELKFSWLLSMEQLELDNILLEFHQSSCHVK
jgi:hypothetical protein